MHDVFISLVIKTNYFVADFAEKLMAYSFGIVSNDMNYKTKDVEIYLKSFWSSFGEISTLWEYLNLVDKYEFNDTIQETIRIINSADVIID